MGAGFSVYARDAGKRGEIFIYEDVGEGWFGGFSAKQFSDEITALGKGVTHLDVHINSYGGDVFDGLAIYNRLVTHGATVHTHIDGIAASIASVIAMAGHEVHMAENAQVMIHNAWGIAAGTAADLRARADLLDSVTGKIAGVYVARTKMPSEEVLAMMDAESWMTADDALVKGFATHVTENLRVAAYGAPNTLFNYRKSPVSPVVTLMGKPVLLSADEEKALREQVQQQYSRLSLAAAQRVVRTRSFAGATKTPLGVVNPAGGNRAT